MRVHASMCLLHTYMHGCLHRRMHLHADLCVQVQVTVLAFVYGCVHVYLFRSVCPLRLQHTCMHGCLHRHICLCAHPCAQVYVNMLAFMYGWVFASICSTLFVFCVCNTHACMDACIDTYACAHTRVRRCMWLCLLLCMDGGSCPSVWVCSSGLVVTRVYVHMCIFCLCINCKLCNFLIN